MCEKVIASACEKAMASFFQCEMNNVADIFPSYVCETSLSHDLKIGNKIALLFSTTLLLSFCYG